jgi:hypothetical protein
VAKAILFATCVCALTDTFDEANAESYFSKLSNQGKHSEENWIDSFPILVDALESRRITLFGPTTVESIVRKPSVSKLVDFLSCVSCLCQYLYVSRVCSILPERDQDNVKK